jgi:acetyltransferase-like isoleucine patch superfamily enzyme
MTRAIAIRFGCALRYVRNLYLRSAGISIGKNTFISLGAKVDVSGKGKITIGYRCEITYGCVILSHDAAVKRIDPKGNRWGPVHVGTNVFVGVNSIILHSVTIGDNSVIGAGSVVTKDIPPNVVAVGNPARVIRQLTAF